MKIKITQKELIQSILSIATDSKELELCIEYEREAYVDRIASLKANCQEFLNIPLVQALSTD